MTVVLHSYGMVDDGGGSSAVTDSRSAGDVALEASGTTEEAEAEPGKGVNRICFLIMLCAPRPDKNGCVILVPC